LNLFSIDDIAAHFLLRTVPDGAPFGTIRTHRTAGGYYKLQRLAILAPYRKFGFGRVLVSALHDWALADAHAHRDAAATVVLHSQLHAKPFYAKCVPARGPRARS
jgi:GNAT superfamily N-acetyltransferase